MSETKEIKLLSTIDSEITSIRAPLAKKIKTINEMIELFSSTNDANEEEQKDHDPIPVQVCTSTLKEVIKWCEFKIELGALNNIFPTDFEFLEKYDMDTVLEITSAADYLNVTVSLFFENIMFL